MGKVNTYLLLASRISIEFVLQ